MIPQVLAVVPARRGSKGLPGKNMLEFGGHPLLFWTLRAALTSKLVSKTSLSTDWAEAASLAVNLGIPVPWLRDPSLAGDESSSVDVVIEAIDRELGAGNHFDVVTLLEPTAPLRKHGDLDCVIELLASNWETADAVVTAGPTSFHPSALLGTEGGFVRQFCGEVEFVERRQAGAAAFLPIGNCFAIKVDALRRERTFYPDRTKMFELEPFQTFEIDTEIDLRVTEFMFSAHKTLVVR